MKKPATSNNERELKQRRSEELNPGSAEATASQSEEKPEREMAGTVEADPETKQSQCVVVGVGASAGGLEAFMELLKPIPDRPGMAFVLIPHLDPKHESAMTELLARGTGMRVREVHDGMKVKADSVYVIPPNRSMTIHRGVLLLAQRRRRRR